MGLTESDIHRPGYRSDRDDNLSNVHNICLIIRTPNCTNECRTAEPCLAGVRCRHSGYFDSDKRVRHCVVVHQPRTTKMLIIVFCFLCQEFAYVFPKYLKKPSAILPLSFLYYNFIYPILPSTCFYINKVYRDSPTLCTQFLHGLNVIALHRSSDSVATWSVGLLIKNVPD